MKSGIYPETTLGKWSVGLQTFFVLVMATAVFLVKGLGVLSFDDSWWDVTVLVFIASILALIIGIVAVRKDKERSWMVYLSIFLGACAILFILLSSLWIND